MIAKTGRLANVTGFDKPNKDVLEFYKMQLIFKRIVFLYHLLISYFDGRLITKSNMEGIKCSEIIY